MTFLDVGIGQCAACAVERRRYLADGSTMALCLPCTTARSRAGVNAQLMTSSDQRKHDLAQARQRRDQLRRMADRRIERAEAGVCRDCGREAKLPNALRGVECNAKHRAANRRRYA